MDAACDIDAPAVMQAGGDAQRQAWVPTRQRAIPGIAGDLLYHQGNAAAGLPRASAFHDASASSSQQAQHRASAFASSLTSNGDPFATPGSSSSSAGVSSAPGQGFGPSSFFSTAWSPIGVRDDTIGMRSGVKQAILQQQQHLQRPQQQQQQHLLQHHQHHHARQGHHHHHHHHQHVSTTPPPSSSAASSTSSSPQQRAARPQAQQQQQQWPTLATVSSSIWGAADGSRGEEPAGVSVAEELLNDADDSSRPPSRASPVPTPSAVAHHVLQQQQQQQQQQQMVQHQAAVAAAAAQHHHLQQQQQQQQAAAAAAAAAQHHQHHAPPPPPPLHHHQLRPQHPAHAAAAAAAAAYGVPAPPQPHHPSAYYRHAGASSLFGAGPHAAVPAPHGAHPQSYGTWPLPRSHSSNGHTRQLPPHFQHGSAGKGGRAGAGPAGSVGATIKRSTKIYIPADQYPEYNFVGRILGPRGQSLKRIEVETGCKIMIRGAGSMRDKAKEAERRGKLGWEHLNEPLHVVIEAEKADELTASDSLSKAKAVIEQLLIPVDEKADKLKQAQLRELAIMKGTLRKEEYPSPPLPSVAAAAAAAAQGIPGHVDNVFESSAWPALGGTFSAAPGAHRESRRVW